VVRTGTSKVLESVDDHGFMQVFGDWCTWSSLSLPIKFSFSFLARLGFGTGGKGKLTAIAPPRFSSLYHGQRQRGEKNEADGEIRGGRHDETQE
jgi:hypothetical protein